MACVFAKPGTSPRTVFGQTDDGRLVHVLDAKPQETLTCPDCGSPLIAKARSTKRIPHFAHKAYAECVRAGETALHKLAKDIIAKEGGLLLPPLDVVVGGQEHRVLKAGRASFDEVEIEQFEDGLRPDLIGVRHARKNGKMTRHRLIIEIRVTHAVDEKKLEILKARGESVIEIDLSGVHRGLSEEELRDHILAPEAKRWLYHRLAAEMEDEVRSEQRQRARAQEQRKAYAVAAEEREERERQTAKETPPSIVSSRIAWAEDEKNKWSLLGMGDLFTRTAEDGLFDVVPILWRTEVFSALAPWSTASIELSKAPPIDRLAQQVARDLRKLGWVKLPFQGQLYKRRAGIKRAWDPICEAITSLLSEGLSEHHLLSRPSYGNDDLSFVARRISKQWEQYKAWRRNLVAFANLSRKLGLEAYYLGRAIINEDAIDTALLLAGETGPRVENVWEDYLHYVSTGKPRYGREVSAQGLRDLGVEISLPGDVTATRSETAIAFVRGQHRSRWQADLDQWIAEESRRAHSCLTRLKKAHPIIEDVSSEMGWDFLFKRRWVDTQVMVHLPGEGPDPLASAKEAATKAAENVMAVAVEIERVEQLASACGRMDMRKAILKEGVIIALGRRASKERRHLRGLITEDDLRSARAAVAALEEIGTRYGYPDDFACRAMRSKPPNIAACLLELILGGFRVEYRKAVNELRTRRDLPRWFA